MAAMNTMLAARAQPTTIGHTNKQTDRQTDRQESHIHDVEEQWQWQFQYQFIDLDALLCAAFSECLYVLYRTQ